MRTAICVFNPDSDSSDDKGLLKKENEFEEQAWRVPKHQRQRVWGKYLAFHAQWQLAFSKYLQFLSIAILSDSFTTPRHLVACFHSVSDHYHRPSCDHGPKSTTFQHLHNKWVLGVLLSFPQSTNRLTVFELVSAYGNIGLSIGLPNANYSTCGAFHPLSKVILCLVMIRGQQQGLPVAIDHAVMLPREFQKELSNKLKEFEMAESAQTTINLGWYLREPPMEESFAWESLHQPEMMNRL